MHDHNGGGPADHQRAAELHDGAAHAHMVASVAHEKQDHLTGHEQSRLALEHSQAAHSHTKKFHPDFGHQEIAEIAHGLWEARGRPQDSPDQDWFHATQALRAEHLSLGVAAVSPEAPVSSAKGGSKIV